MDERSEMVRSGAGWQITRHKDSYALMSNKEMELSFVDEISKLEGIEGAGSATITSERGMEIYLLTRRYSVLFMIPEIFDREKVLEAVEKVVSDWMKPAEGESGTNDGPDS